MQKLGPGKYIRTKQIRDNVSRWWTKARRKKMSKIVKEWSKTHGCERVHRKTIFCNENGVCIDLTKE